MRLTDAWGNKHDAYKTIEEAFEAYKDEYLDGAEPDPDETISLGVGKDLDGEYWFTVGWENDFTNCTIKDLKNDNPWFGSWSDWYKEEWIEQEEED